MKIWRTGIKIPSCLFLLFFSALCSCFFFLPLWSWVSDCSFHEFYYFGRYLCFLLFHIKDGEVSMSLILYGLLFSSPAEEIFRGTAHFSYSLSLSFSLSLSIALSASRLSSTIPSSQNWGTTMLVINFLIPFISLSPTPLPPHILSAISLSSLSLPSSPSFIVCCSLISMLPFLQGSCLGSAPSPSYSPMPIHHSINAAWFLLHLSVRSFDLHEITALPESVWPRKMEGLLFKSRLRRAIDACGIDVSVESVCHCNLGVDMDGFYWLRSLIFLFFGHFFLINLQRAFKE